MSDSVACPCCSEMLYTTAVMDEQNRALVDGPELQQTDNRLFMICPNCENEIDFIDAGQIRPSPIQSCKINSNKGNGRVK